MSKRFDWGLHPQVETFLNDKIAIFLDHNNIASKLSARMHKETSTFFFDWVDHIALPETKVNQNELETLGFQEFDGLEAPQSSQIYIFPRATYL
jgi:hypothetical protein